MALPGRSQLPSGPRARKDSAGTRDPDVSPQRGRTLLDLVLLCTTRLSGENLLRVLLPRRITANRTECEVMIDQSRAIDNRRFVRTLHARPRALLREVEEKLRRLSDP